MQGLKLTTEQVIGGRLGSRSGRSALAADIGHAEHRRLGATPADREIHRAVLGMNQEIGQRKRTSAEELLLLCLVTAAIRREVNRVHRSVGPIIGEDGVLIFCREFGAATG